jgi:hypothetical protein
VLLGEFVVRISTDELQFCLEKAKEISEQYKLISIASDDPQRSADYLRDCCQQYLKIKIEVQRIDIDRNSSAVLGAFFKNGDGTYTICYASGLNYCWMRYTVCKELFHVILDREEYRNMDLEAHITEVTVAFPDRESEPSASVRSEVLAEIAAMEFMFPYAERVQELNGPHKDNCLAIAEKYKVPQVYVERYLSESYMDALKEYSQ